MPEDQRDLIYDKVVKTISDVSGHSAIDINGQTELFVDLSLDSLALFEIVIELEESFDIRISDEDVDKIKTIDDIVNYIERHEPAGK